MNAALKNEPVSIARPEFTAVVEGHIARNELVVVYARYAYKCGYAERFLVRSMAEFGKLVRSMNQRTSLTVWFESAFQFRGVADNKLRKRTLEFIRINSTCRQGEPVFALCDDAPEGLLEYEHFVKFSEPHEVNEWFDRNLDKTVLVGRLPYWEDNCDDFVTAYVPDADGVVRPGAY